MTIEMAIYLTEVLYSIGQTLCLFLFLFILAFICYIFSASYGRFEGDDKAYHYSIRRAGVSLIFILIISLIGIFIPSQKGMYAILSVHYMKQSDLPAKFSKALNAKLDSYLAEMGEKE